MSTRVCKNCGQPVEAASELSNGSRWKHSGRFRVCFPSESTSTWADVETGEVPE